MQQGRFFFFKVWDFQSRKQALLNTIILKLEIVGLLKYMSLKLGKSNQISADYKGGPTPQGIRW